MTTTQFIDTPEKLDAFLSQIHSAPWVAIDTEFQREKTFYAKLCLIQLATPDLVAIVDPLAIDNWGPLSDWLYQDNLLKVFHAARQDQELFYDRTGQPLPNVFDTQIAAPLLGHPEQAGYARLVQDILGVTLKKSHSRTDWTRRPLSDAQLVYAADDVIYLAQMYPILQQQLDEKDRLPWLEKEMAKLSDPNLYASPPELAWKRIRHSKQMKGSSLAIVQKIAAWREQQAQTKDIPRGWLMKDEVIIDLAKQKPTDEQSLSHIRGLNASQRGKLGNTLLDLVQQGIQTTPQAAPKHQRSPAATTDEEALVDYLMAFVRLRCQASEMNPASVTSRQELIQLIRGEPSLEILSGWRSELVGLELQQVLSGHKKLTVNTGKLIVEDC